MKHLKVSAVLSIIALAHVVTTAQSRLVSDSPQMSPDRKVAYAERLIEGFYIDDVDGDKLAETAIAAMLETLDPHSSYSDPEETKEMTTPLDGNFSGIGIQFNMLNDTLYVIQTVSGGPSEKVGIVPGDRILSADKEPISGVKKSNSDILKLLRGPKGSVVDVDVIRKGENTPVTFRIIRDDIPLNSVDAAFMADRTTGYIRISRFADKTDDELVEAMKKLKKQGMVNLIIDLEDNGGGYLGSAYKIASHFLNKGELVTYTESPKTNKMTYEVEKNGDFRSGRVVVMVNQYSASASEILSGAIQDNDRGLIVGRRTFGKGLVQRPFPFPDGSMIKLTVSRYHTPSGRSIQKPYEAGNADDYRMDMFNRYENGEFQDPAKISFPDSLKYYTLKNHRVVYGGGGIMPDHFVPVDTAYYTDYFRDLVAKGVLSKFAISYVDANRQHLKDQYPAEKQFVDGFDVTPAMITDLVRTGVKEGVAENPEELKTSYKMIRAIVKGLIGRDIYRNDTYFMVVNPILNSTYRAALELINDEVHYNSLLAGRTVAKS